MSDPSVSSCVCGVRLPSSSGPVHPYVPATAACWEVFGLLQADEYERFGYSNAHGLLVDAYMASHPGSDDRRNRQSIVLHVVGLCSLVEFDFGFEDRADLLRSLAHRDYPRWDWEGPPADGVSVMDVLFAEDEQDLFQGATTWAKSVWSAWSPHADQARALVLARGA